MSDQEIARVKFCLEATADIEFDAEDVTSKLTPLQVADLIVEMDNEVGEWEHTLLLYHHFAAQFEVAKAAMPDLAAMTPGELRDNLEQDVKDAEEEAVNGG